MKNHIILCAFGTTTRAKETYRRFEERLAPRFPDCRIHWTFSSPTVRRAANQKSAAAHTDIAATLAKPEKVAVQSLHILPGYEFHRTVVETRKLSLPAAIGRPLLDRPQDFVRAAGALKDVVTNSGHDAALVLGPGTDHPCRYLFLQLEKELQRQLGEQILFTTLEKPLIPAEQIIEKIAAAGHRSVYCIPFLMVAGMHLYRDIIGVSDDSWHSRFRHHRIDLDVRDQGIALLDEIVSIFADHIEAAFATLNRGI
ncbi:MAG: sirohydrochlorin cobaltochelatase [Desulfofustis sp.]